MGPLASKSVSALLLTAAIFVLVTKEAHAYIDLGSGSFLIQVLLASFFASMFTIKFYWNRLKLTVHRLVSKLRNADVNAE